MTDIDIDFFDRDKALGGLPCVMAVTADRRRHQTGVYFHDIPVDPIDGFAVWDYETAAQKGYFKVDLLNNSIYRDVRDEAHLIAMMADPPWDVFDDSAIVAELAHIGNHFDVVHAIKPRCLEDLAVCLALVRPGKRHLVGQPRHVIDQDIWTPTKEYYFKRSHALSYAMTIIVQLNLLIEKAHM